MRYPLRKIRLKYLSDLYNSFNEKQKREWIFKQVKSIAIYAQENNEFYGEYYSEKGFDARSLKCFEDLNRIPIVNKELLRSAGSKWNSESVDTFQGNTGGTSGNPLGFSFDKTQVAKESVFIGKIWSELNCSYRSTRLVFRGLNILGDQSWSYHPGTDSFLINTYLPLERMKLDLLVLFTNNEIEFLHGYPSAIYHFAKFCLLPENVDLKLLIQRKLKGVLFGSEYPAPVYRDVVDKAFLVPSISWYGHSEMVVLAAEHQVPFSYHPFQVYGWCESVNMSDGSFHLVGTNYENKNSPFIRYDTGDGIQPIKYVGGILETFRILEGRLGEFILDASKNPISLTSLIFGRHHSIFDKAKFIQISQEKPGMATLYVTSGDSNNSSLEGGFDVSNVDIDFKVVYRSEPYRTTMGKVPLRIPPEETSILD